jgi:hypothetical protein
LLYGVETKVLNQAVKRNSDRFPEEFMFQINNDELSHLKLQIGFSKKDSLRSQNVTLDSARENIVNICRMPLPNREWRCSQQS